MRWPSGLGIDVEASPRPPVPVHEPGGGRRKKNGGFKRTADLRRVKGFGYKTFKRLEPFSDIKGDSTLK